MAIITNLQPPAGTPIAADAALRFDVIDPLVDELRVFVWAVFRATGQVELVHDGEFFQPLYSFSTITPTPGGRTFTVRRVGGWPSQPELRVDTCACPPELDGGGLTAFANVGVGAGVGRDITLGTLNLRSLRSSDSSVSIVQEADSIDLTSGAGTTGGRDPVTDIGINPVPSGDYDLITLGMGQRAQVQSPTVPATKVRVAFPTIQPGDGGRRIGLVLFEDNSLFDIETDSADFIVTPTPDFLPPGVRLAIPAGALTAAYNVPTWEAVEGLEAIPPGEVITISPSDLLSVGLPTTITISGTGGTLPAFPADLDVVLIEESSSANVTILSASQVSPGGAWTIDVSVDSASPGLHDVYVIDNTTGQPFAILFGGVSIDGTADPRQPTGNGWLFDWNTSGGGGGPPPSADWATVLGVGEESGGNDPVITDGDELRFGTDITADRRAATSARLYASLGAPAGWSDMGDPLTSPALAGGESLAVIRATFVARLGLSAGSGSTEYAVIEEAWRGPGTGGVALLRTITAEGSAGTVFRLSTDISNNIVAQIQPGTGVAVEAIAHITVVEHPGFGSV